ncbi:MAG: macrolide ABC transporter ATP-binding protein [Candidatus Riflebacteria bacterium HGW-Riflebacteria-2]|jgi:putative ABC transport system ATP-binding protein|nr:MAG: macrolide ABC transporter ATP-binding protein [Candidatus Riflebacteria bacterium HGW-Riflebacteria-2]
MSIVSTTDLKRVYESGATEVKAVNGVSLSIEAGEFAVLAGPSGSGKTTLLNLIGGLDRPTNGSVHLDGELLNDKSDDELTRARLFKIGFIFQAYNLVPVLSAYENVQFILQIQGVPDSEHAGRIMPLFEELGLSDLAHRRPGELSGGQQQRVAVARAIIGRPSIILADEPTANLDSESAVTLLNLMHRLNLEQKVTFLFSSHDSKVINIAQRVISMRDGKISDDVKKQQ